ncbi:MAG: hypothetical protein EHM39_06570 [Chloroflexi bacterium]|nr:MAG: hypothetical protein EHM39_06570 [Chloroflexota bacterium]
MLSRILILTIGLLVLETRVHLTPAGHKVILLGIVVLIYSLIGVWIQSNAEGLAEPAVEGPSQEFWHSDRLEWNNGKEGPSDGLDRLDDERSFDTLRI